MGLGQFVGSKRRVRYTSDDGENYSILRDETLADVPNVDLPEIDPGGNPAITGGTAPKGLKFRGVWWQANDDVTPEELQGARKFLICGTTTSTLYQSSERQAVTVDGIAGTTTGRVGEKLRFI